MKRLVLLLLTIFLVFAIPVSYGGGGGGGHGGGGHGGGGHGGGGHGGGGHGGGGHGGGRHGGHGGHHGGHGGVFFGYGGYYPGSYYYYYPPYYPAYAIVTKPAAPTIYVEKSTQAEPYYWYYCTSPKGYYPHVERCPAGWLQVIPKSPRH